MPNEEIIRKFVSDETLYTRFLNAQKSQKVNNVINDCKGDHKGWVEMAKHNSHTNPYFGKRR